ncbi:hypothetical protein DEJ27_12170 [Curtobacterium sp. MCPF17_018]|uniref:helix-turn-helix domain-containing protein n=1 Tax=Curtobacterium sp. MCPF17_018 TaxID=2175638 RepID=UPI000DA6F8D2|nr:helix-turn-helix domain-containing protein [Curtobacterium sp. MCPF17_018]PZE67373.1 hypothetical protein DEJ27_12170 [Curtobacterium sp. MCPF17_018]
MNIVRVGQVLQTTEGDRTIVAYDGLRFKLRDEANLVTEIVSAGSLSELLVEPLEKAQVSYRELGLVTAAAKKNALWRERHVLEVLDGSSRADGPMTQLFDATRTTLGERKRAKADELRISCSTIDNWIHQYREAGVAGLIDRRQTRPSGGVVATPKLREAYEKIIDAETNRATGTFGRLYDDFEDLCARGGILSQVKSESQTRRDIRALTSGKYTLESARSRRTAANSPDREFESREAWAPGLEVQIDSSPANIEALDFFGHRRRLCLTTMIDKCTRSIAAEGATVVAAKGYDHVLLLARALVPLQNRPHSSFPDHILERIGAPWAQYLSRADLDASVAARPFIRPQRIMCDNGPDFKSASFRAACAKSEVSLTEAATYSPDDKADEERFWGTIDTGFCQYMPGYVGNSVENRGRATADEDLLRIDEVIALFEVWVTFVYQRRTHTGLRDPLNPQIPISPNAAFMAYQDVGADIPLPFSRDDYIDLLPIKNRTIRSDGIEIGYGKYDSPLLTPLRRMPSRNAGHTSTWPVRFDPYDRSAVWVQNPDDGSWIECDLRNAAPAAQPFRDLIGARTRHNAASNPPLSAKAGRRTTKAIVAVGKAAHEDRIATETQASRESFALQQRVAAGTPPFHDVETPAEREPSANQFVSEAAAQPSAGTLAGIGRRFDSEED